MALVSVWKALCTCPFAFWVGNWLPPRPELAEAKGDAGLCFERQPELNAGIGTRPRSSPYWPQISESCQRASALPPPVPGANGQGRASRGHCAQSCDPENISSTSQAHQGWALCCLYPPYSVAHSPKVPASHFVLDAFLHMELIQRLRNEGKEALLPFSVLLLVYRALLQAG